MTRHHYLLAATIACLGLPCDASRMEMSTKVHKEAKPIQNDYAREIETKFSQGEVLVHMKRDFSHPDSTLARWQKQDSVDQSLSFSLIHPQMPLEKLWVKHGYFFDGAKCEPLVGSMSDLWVNNEVQHGSHLILTTPEGQRAELLRMMWLRNTKGGAPIHVVFPQGFGEWAIHPDAWAPHEKSVFTARNPFEEKDTIETIPTAEALTEFMEAVDAGSTSIFRVADLKGMSENVMQDYNLVPPRIKFTEVLAMCPLSALLGYVYSVQEIFGDEIERYRSSKLAEGRKIIEAIRKNIPALASQALSIVEYANTSDDDLEKKEPTANDFALKKPTAKHHLAMMEASTTTGNQPQVIQWKDSYLAKLVVVETDLP